MTDTDALDDASPVIGRFAPSPTGKLHVGSLLTALASYCHAKHQGGQWLLRIEDTDWQRCRTEHSSDILSTLDAYGLHWDADVRHQHHHLSDYDDALEQLRKHALIYACECSRKSLAEHAARHHSHQSSAPIYPRLCIDKALDFADNNIRIKSPDVTIEFVDLIQGATTLNPQQMLGDMVLKRRDGIINYVLSAALDDAVQGITHVVRGLDLLTLTPCQRILQDSLGLPVTPHYGHLPLALNADGRKLSKQTHARAIGIENIPDTLHQLLAALRQPPVDTDTPARMLAQAVSQWNTAALSQQTEIDGHFT